MKVQGFLRESKDLHAALLLSVPKHIATFPYRGENVSSHFVVVGAGKTGILPASSWIGVVARFHDVLRRSAGALGTEVSGVASACWPWVVRSRTIVAWRAIRAVRGIGRPGKVVVRTSWTCLRVGGPDWAVAPS